jgi:hypothetical protein
MVLASCTALFACACIDSPGNVCSRLESRAPSARLAASPRDEPHLEMLSLALTGDIVAHEDDYQAVVDDVDAIRNEHPELRDIENLWKQDDGGGGFVVDANSPESLDAMRDGRSTQWNCLDDHFTPDVQWSTAYDDGVTLYVGFSDVLNHLRVAEWYESIPEVAEVHGGVRGVPSNICAAWDGPIHRYLFEIVGSTACPHGCDGELRLFSVDRSGAVSELAVPNGLRPPFDAPGYSCAADVVGAAWDY